MGNARTDSDVDLLVEFDLAHVPGLLGITAMEIELSMPDCSIADQEALILGSQPARALDDVEATPPEIRRRPCSAIAGATA